LPAEFLINKQRNRKSTERLGISGASFDSVFASSDHAARHIERLPTRLRQRTPSGFHCGKKFFAAEALASAAAALCARKTRESVPSDSRRRRRERHIRRSPAARGDTSAMRIDGPVRE